MTGSELKESIIQEASLLGFDICHFTSANLPAETGKNLEVSISKNHHASMEWLETTLQRRKTPTAMWEDAKTAILFGFNYGPENNPLDILDQTKKAAISVYAQNRDYHDVMKGRLKQIASKIASKTKEQVKVFVDTAPLMEKPLAAQAGVGWQGKHTNLVSREFGSWLFLGAILTSHVIQPDEPESDHCGSCNACIDICPTKAFPAPYQLDARRCISYLTIEHKGSIPREFRKPIGNRIYGCDDCLAVCPWNKYAQQANEIKLKPREDLQAPELIELAELDDADFRSRFSGSPIKRIGRDQFIRNVLIAIGNSNSSELKSTAINHLQAPNPIVRSAAVWATAQLESKNGFLHLQREIAKTETDPDVLEEWKTGNSQP